MRRFRETNARTAFRAGFLALIPLFFSAQTVSAANVPAPSYVGASAALQQQQQALTAQQMQQMQQMQAAGAPGAASALSPYEALMKQNPGMNLYPNAPPPPPDLGDVKDKDSAAYKSKKLGERATKERNNAFGRMTIEEEAMGREPPPEMESLQRVNQANLSKYTMTDDTVLGDVGSLDMRRDAQKEAALSYGARGGLAKRSYEIMERMKGFDSALDKVFDFRSLLVKAPSGLLIEPPIVKESIDALVIDNKGEEAAVAQEIYDINKQAKIVSAPRDWRQYIVQNWSSEVSPPPRILWPKNEEEQKRWNAWVEQGWDAGIVQADEIFETSLSRLAADYGGMVRYRMLLSQGMISKPYAMHEDRGVTGDNKQMRVGDRALRITGPSQFMTGANLWKPADR